MKNAVALIAVAGIASVAAAQNFSLSMTPSVSQTVEGGNFTVTVYGDADMGSHILGGAFGLSSDSALIDSMTWSPAAWSAFNTDGGYAGNGNYNEVIFGQLVIPVIDFQLVASTGDFSLQSVDSVSGALADDSQGQLSLGSASVTVTPAPSALALLGLGGLAAGRRRR